MNSLLTKHKPKDITAAEYQAMLERNSYLLTPLINAIKEMANNNNKINKDDFDSPNHYAKLAFQAGENKGYDFVLSLLPKFD